MGQQVPGTRGNTDHPKISPCTTGHDLTGLFLTSLVRPTKRGSKNTDPLGFSRQFSSAQLPLFPSSFFLLLFSLISSSFRLLHFSFQYRFLRFLVACILVFDNFSDTSGFPRPFSPTLLYIYYHSPLFETETETKHQHQHQKK
jgi:hypothetical protein